MNEKLFKRVKGSGAAAITTGIITVVAGAACGILMIVTGAKLLAAQAGYTFLGLIYYEKDKTSFFL